MKIRLRHGLSLAVFSIVCLFVNVFSVFAANIAGGLEEVSKTEIIGWAADKDTPDQSAEVILYLYVDGSAEARELAKVKADQYRNDLEKTIGNGNHSFSYSIDWDSIEGSSFIIQAYMVSGSDKVLIGEPAQYNKNSPYHSGIQEKNNVKASSSGPAGLPEKAEEAEKEPPAAEPLIERGVRGAFLGNFISTAYCSCDVCSSGTGVTYSGAIPRANHTISADISRYPIGTKLMIGDVVYTVEDIGSSISGKRLDVYFDSHEDALHYGRQSIEVYTVQ